MCTRVLKRTQMSCVKTWSPNVSQTYRNQRSERRFHLPVLTTSPLLCNGVGQNRLIIRRWRGRDSGCLGNGSVATLNV